MKTLVICGLTTAWLLFGPTNADGTCLHLAGSLGLYTGQIEQSNDVPQIENNRHDDLDADQPARVPDIYYVPTPQKVVDLMLELGDVKSTDLLYDLGCGDGRFVVTAAKKYGCQSIGIDIDPARVRDSLENVRKAKVESLVTILEGDVFEQDFSEADVVMLFLKPELNVRLIPQLEKMKQGSRVVSHNFDMMGVPPDTTVTYVDSKDGEHSIYLWTIPFREATMPNRWSMSGITAMIADNIVLAVAIMAIMLAAIFFLANRYLGSIQISFRKAASRTETP